MISDFISMFRQLFQPCKYTLIYVKYMVFLLLLFSFEKRSKKSFLITSLLHYYYN